MLGWVSCEGWLCWAGLHVKVGHVGLVRCECWSWWAGLAVKVGRVGLGGV